MEETEIKLDELREKVGALEIELPYEKARNRIFGLEGQAGVYYWEMVRLLLPKDIPYPGRITRGAKDLVNGSLNLGYSLLYPRIERALLMGRLNLCTSLLTRGRDVSITTGGRLSSESAKMVIEAVVGRLGTLVPYKGEKITLEQVIFKQARLLARSLRNEKKFKAFISRY